MQIGFEDTEKIKLLSLTTFSWDANETSRLFQGCKTVERFISILERLLPRKETGGSNNTLEMQPSTSKKHANSTATSVLMPASRQARLECVEHKEPDDLSETEMDKTIQSHFQGMYSLLATYILYVHPCAYSFSLLQCIMASINTKSSVRSYVSRRKGGK